MGEYRLQSIAWTPSAPHYAASKAGIHGLTHSYAALLAKEGITVNVIAPALIDTEMMRDNPRARPDLIPVGRFGRWTRLRMSS